VSSDVVFHTDAELRSPTLVLAYAGWSDAGEAATMAVRHLLEQLETRELAYIDTEEYFDFTVVRPHARRSDDGGRRIVWPNHEFFAVRVQDARNDVILGLGIEPHLRWRSYARAMLEVVRRSKVQRVIMLGAFLADVIYSQPIAVNGSAADPELARRLGLRSPSYEGPTGILGVLADAFRREGVEAISLWASLPHYVSLFPNSRGALALLNQLGLMTDVAFDLQDLQKTAAEFDEQVSEFIANDPQLAAYVRELKKRAFSQ
jgi:predicted ATP-grasp superfamily ATP-dependent carboligase